MKTQKIIFLIVLKLLSRCLLLILIGLGFIPIDLNRRFMILIIFTTIIMILSCIFLIYNIKKKTSNNEICKGILNGRN